MPFFVEEKGSERSLPSSLQTSIMSSQHLTNLSAETPQARGADGRAEAAKAIAAINPRAVGGGEEKSELEKNVIPIWN